MPPSGPTDVAGARPRAPASGFALIEVMIALLLIALIAALAMPGLVRPTGPGTLRIAAMNVSALLRRERSAALASGRDTFAVASGQAVAADRSGSIVMPPGAVAGPRGAAIRFTPDGRASGGPLTLASRGSAFLIAADPFSGAIDVSER